MFLSAWFKSARNLGLLALIVSITNCTSPRTPSSQTNDLAYDRTANNVALFFGSPNDLNGVTPDIEKNVKLFNDQSFGFGFKVVAKNYARKHDIIAMTKEQAQQVGPNGTMLWYFSGHGAENGAMITQGYDGLYFKEVTEAIRSVRNVKMKRLIVVIDNCFSGKNLVGSNAIIPTTISLTENDVTDEQLTRVSVATVNRAFDGFEQGFAPVSGSRSSEDLFEQAIVITASTSTETSGDTDSGGVFSEAWRGVIQKLKSAKPNATLRDMAELTRDRTKNYGGHTPQFKAYPSDAVLNDLLFQPTNNAIGNTGGSSNFNIAPTLALVETGNPAQTGIYILGSLNVAVTALCYGDKATCSATPNTVVGFAVSKDASFANKKLFKSSNNIGLVANMPYTILQYSQQNQLISARTVLFKPNTNP